MYVLYILGQYSCIRDAEARTRVFSSVSVSSVSVSSVAFIMGLLSLNKIFFLLNLLIVYNNYK